MSERRDSGGLSPDDEQVAGWARALSDDPTSPVFYDLARALLARRAPKRAALVLKGALTHHPDRDDARLLLGEALLASGRGRACTREMARVLSRQPDHLGALKLLARALRFEGQREEARGILERARELAPADTEIAGMLADPGPPAIAVRERDGRVTALVGDDESEVLEPTGSFGSSVRFLTDPLAEPTVRDVPLSFEEARRPVDPPEVFTSSHRVPDAGASSADASDDEDAEDATRPMSMPPFEEMMAAELSAMLFEADDGIPSVQVSPSLALEAARLAEAGLIEGARAARLPATPSGSAARIRPRRTRRPAVPRSRGGRGRPWIWSRRPPRHLGPRHAVRRQPGHTRQRRRPASVPCARPDDHRGAVHRLRELRRAGATEAAERPTGDRPTAELPARVVQLGELGGAAGARPPRLAPPARTPRRCWIRRQGAVGHAPGPAQRAPGGRAGLRSPHADGGLAGPAALRVGRGRGPPQHGAAPRGDGPACRPRPRCRPSRGPRRPRRRQPRPWPRPRCPRPAAGHRPCPAAATCSTSRWIPRVQRHAAGRGAPPTRCRTTWTRAPCGWIGACHPRPPERPAAPERKAERPPERKPERPPSDPRSAAGRKPERPGRAAERPAPRPGPGATGRAAAPAPARPPRIARRARRRPARAARQPARQPARGAPARPAAAGAGPRRPSARPRPRPPPGHVRRERPAAPAQPVGRPGPPPPRAALRPRPPPRSRPASVAHRGDLRGHHRPGGHLRAAGELPHGLAQRRRPGGPRAPISQ
ncbi:MAG: hypothetical protein R3F43_21825 [bacterium]